MKGQGILATCVGDMVEIHFRFDRSAIVTGSFDSADSPLRGESAALRMTGFFVDGDANN
jgi:hypothetical protein